MGEWLSALWNKFICSFRPRRRPKQDLKRHLVCSECERNIHRHERYTIIAVKHRDCLDRRQVGQMILPSDGGNHR